MNKKVMIGAAAAACAALTAVAATKNRSAGPKPSMWDKMRQGMEEMPEDFPPRIMFDNIEATRANSERILELLEEQQGSEDTGASGDDIEIVHNT